MLFNFVFVITHQMSFTGRVWMNLPVNFRPTLLLLVTHVQSARQEYFQLATAYHQLWMSLESCYLQSTGPVQGLVSQWLVYEMLAY